ncbi:MAG: hypothetical protein OEY22_04005 [Candidatus Bathyarchaeota archaeon]|nr:hypothetical protein [Candidatus Bathyarchaeota archaeon]
MEEHSWKFLLSRYFLHGILFSLIFLGLGFVWVITFVLLVSIASFIGLVLGIIILFFILGGLNVFLTEKIWSMYVKTDWERVLAHGLVLFFVLIIAHIPTMFVNFFVNFLIPKLATTTVLFIITAFIDGYVAKNVAARWQEEEYVE